MATVVRRLALNIIERSQDRRATLATLMADQRVETLPANDRALLQELVFGVLRRRGALDHALAHACDRPLSEIRPRQILTVLRLGTYQLLHMRTPHYAAVSEGVALARDVSPTASGFVNAILRRVAREGPPAPPDPRSDPLSWLTTEGSLPDWLARRWHSRLGADAAVRRAQAFLAPARVVFRVNPRVPDALTRVEQAGLTAGPLALEGAWEGHAGRGIDLSRSSTIQLMDLGSQLIAHMAATPGRTLDACAAPGGKTLLMADLLGKEGWIVAAERSPRRLATLADRVDRWGAPNVFCCGADALLPPFGRPFDAILLDAPCSGLGTLSRHPDIRWNCQPAELIDQQRRQKALLVALAHFVRPGGRLLYSTCSTEPEENEDVIEAFLAERADFAPEPIRSGFAAFCQGPYARILPERDGFDAFFCAPLRRT
jgi:16S rRNA (cytosine967-C5)-methyltransferase